MFPCKSDSSLIIKRISLNSYQDKVYCRIYYLTINHFVRGINFNICVIALEITLIIGFLTFFFFLFRHVSVYKVKPEEEKQYSARFNAFWFHMKVRVHRRVRCIENKHYRSSLCNKLHDELV